MHVNPLIFVLFISPLHTAPFQTFSGVFFHVLIIVFVTCTAVLPVFFGLVPTQKYLSLDISLTFQINLGTPSKNLRKNL